MRNKTFVYDNGGTTIDRYSIHIHRSYGRPRWDVYTMAPNPSIFNQYSHTDYILYHSPKDKRISIKDLPKEVRQAIKLRQKE